MSLEKWCTKRAGTGPFAVSIFAHYFEITTAYNDTSTLGIFN